MKNNLLIILLFLAHLILQGTAYADAFDATPTGGTLRSNITMSVAIPTCSVNNGQGIGQTVNIPSATIDDLNNGNAPTGDAYLTVDCSHGIVPSAGIVLSVAPAGSSTVIGSSDGGVIATDKSGVGLLLTWHDGQSVSLNATQPRVFPVSQAQHGIWETSITAKPIKIPGQDLNGGGFYKGTVIVTLSYS